MRFLRLVWLPLLLAACQLRTPVLNRSQYICPDGRTLWVGMSRDGRLMRLTLEGRTYTLRRQGDDGSYSNSRYSVRRDDLFLRLGSAGTLLPQHCRLLTQEESGAVPPPPPGPL